MVVIIYALIAIDYGENGVELYTASRYILLPILFIDFWPCLRSAYITTPLSFSGARDAPRRRAPYPKAYTSVKVYCMLGPLP